MTAMAHALYVGRVMHARLHPFTHRFRQRVFSLLVDLDRVDQFPTLLSSNRFNLFSIHDRDHGRRDGSPLRPWIEAQLGAAGMTPPDGPYRMLCFPRVLGFVFNPLTVYFCHQGDGTLAAVLYEVKNTFGDQHVYVCAVSKAESETGAAAHSHPKEFHVSPFFNMDGDYRFRLLIPGDAMAVTIRYTNSHGNLLIATQTGRRQILSNAALLKQFITIPLLTIMVVLGIHWQAWKLWRKGARYHPRPEPPMHPKTPFARTQAQQDAVKEMRLR